MALMSFEQRLKYLVYTPVAVAPLSLAGSLLTLITIYRTYRASGSLMTYHRLLMGVSVLDVFLSTGYALGPLMLPKDLDYQLPGVHNTHGTMGTCTFQAFLLQLGHGAFTYNMLLLLYYVLIIRYSLKNDFIQKRIEPVMHVVAIGFHLGVSVAGLFLEVFNPAGGVCWVAAKPLGCDEFDFLECERGEEHKVFYHLWLSVAPLVAVTCLLLLFLIILGYTVWWRNLQRKRFVFERGLGYGGANDTMDRRSRMVITQCMLYGATMTNAVLWASILHIWEIRGEFEVSEGAREYWMQAVWVFFFPLQGLFNFLIFIRPRYVSIRNEGSSGHTHMPRFWALVEAVLYPVDTRTQRESRQTVRNSRMIASSQITSQITNSQTSEPISKSLLSSSLQMESKSMDMVNDETGQKALPLQQQGLKPISEKSMEDAVSSRSVHTLRSLQTNSSVAATSVVAEDCEITDQCDDEEDGEDCEITDQCDDDEASSSKADSSEREFVDEE